MVVDKESVELGLIGCGGFGSHLATEIFQDVEGLRLGAVYDVDRPAAQRLGERLAVPVASSVEEMFGIPSADAVLIATPHDTHRRLTVMAAEAGKHIFCEKAMASNVHECWAMVRAAEANGVKLMIGHKRRLRPPWARMIELAQKELGAPLAIEVPGFHDALSQRVQTLCNGLQERANAARVPMMTQSAGGMFGVFFTSQSRVDNFAQATACNPDAFRRFFGAMLDHGVYLAPSAYEAGFMSSAHTPEDIQLTLDAAEKAFAVM